MVVITSQDEQADEHYSDFANTARLVRSPLARPYPYQWNQRLLPSPMGSQRL